MIGEMWAAQMRRLILFSLVTAFALGALAVWGLPKLWRLVKPLIHSVTG